MKNNLQFGFELEISQQQKLILSQNMKQAIKILQMSANDLREYIDREFEENPVLEGEFDYSEIKDQYKEELDYKEVIKYLESDNYSSGINNYYNDDEISPFSFIAQKKSLKDYLKEQLAESKVNEKVKIIVEYMIESIDNKGYLEESIDNISNGLKIDNDLVNEALSILQRLEPCGIGARTLEECLILQLKRKKILDINLEKIISNYLKEIGENKYNYIAKRINVTIKEAQDYGDIIKTLEPKPSRGYYTGDEIKFIIPDAYIVKIESQYSVILNTGIIPKLQISNIYKQIINSESNKNESDYVKEKMNSAINLMKNIEQRNNTLLKVLEEIVLKQIKYFDYGIKYLKPMTLKDISLSLEIHESTVSRAINDKYVLTKNGTIKIKDLFTQGILNNCNNNENISIIRVKERIKEVIQTEDKKRPLSDQLICDLLSSESFNISRRTVAKYREEMCIQSSAKRKRV